MSEDIAKEVGKRLRFERNIRHLSQEEMAFRLGISDRQLRRYEKGEVQMPLAILYRLFWDFEIDLNYLIAGEFAEDHYVITATAVMPQDLLDKLIVPIYESSQSPTALLEMSDEIYERDMRFFGIMACYGQMHGNDKQLREPLRVPYFLMYHVLFEKPLLPMNYMPLKEDLETVLSEL